MADRSAGSVALPSIGEPATRCRPEDTGLIDQDYEISRDRGRMDVDAIHAYLSRSYWSPGVGRATVSRAIAHSLCIGAFHRRRQVGFARAVSDYATFAWIADVYVLEPHRGRGLARRMIQTMLSWPELQGLRRTMLATKDAHGLYARWGFAPLEDAGQMLVRRGPVAGTAARG